MKTIHLLYAANNRMLPSFPEASLALASVLLEKRHRVRITDLVFTPPSQWEFEDPLFFGLTIYSNETLSHALSAARWLRREFPTTRLIWGGPHAQMMPFETARHPLVDAVCYGEGEVPIVQLAEQLTAGAWDPSAIDGLVFRTREGLKRTREPAQQDLNALPYYPYHLIDHQKYMGASRKVYYQTSRNCPFRCTFCSYHRSGKWRAKSADKVLRELHRLVAELSARQIYFSDANFFVDLKRVRAICEGMASHPLDISWSAFCRFDTLDSMDDAMLQLLKRTGCHHLDLGGESGSDDILRQLNKNISRESILRGVERLCTVGIRPELSFIAGLPLGTEMHTEETLSLIRTIRARYPAATINGFFPYNPYPDSPLGQKAIADWELPIPKTLEEWSRDPIKLPRRNRFPWLTNGEYSRMLTRSSIISYQFLYGRLVDSVESNALAGSLRFLLARKLFALVHGILIRHLITLRTERKIQLFPVEWRAFSWLRDKLLRTN